MSANKFSFIQEVYKVKTFGTTHLLESSIKIIIRRICNESLW